MVELRGPQVVMAPHGAGHRASRVGFLRKSPEEEEGASPASIRGPVEKPAVDGPPRGMQLPAQRGTGTHTQTLVHVHAHTHRDIYTR